MNEVEHLTKVLFNHCFSSRLQYFTQLNAAGGSKVANKHGIYLRNRSGKR